MEMAPLFQFISDVGFPIAIAVVGGMFALNALKYVFTNAIDYLDRLGSEIKDTEADIFAVQKQVVDVDYSVSELLDAEVDIIVDNRS